MIEILSIIGLFLITPWVIFALLAALTDSGVGFVDEWLLKKLNEKKSPEIDAAGRLVLISGFFGFVVTVLAIIYATLTGMEVGQNGVFIGFVAGLLEVTWLIPYFYALNKGGAVSTTPLFQTVPIFSLLFGFLLFCEVPIVIHLVATATIILGAVLLNYSQQSKSLNKLTIGLMFLASAIISLEYFLFKDAAIEGGFISAVIGNGLGMTTLSLAIYTFYTPYRKQLNEFLTGVDYKVLFLQGGNELLYSLHSLLNQIAIFLGPSVVVVSAFNAFHPVFTLLIGILLAWLGSQTHKENLTGSNLLIKSTGIALIALGTVLLALN